MRIFITSLALILLGVMHGCGLKGPLYLPEPAKPVEAEHSQEQDADKETKKKTPPTVPTASEPATR